jgi:hypothetical protein
MPRSSWSPPRRPSSLPPRAQWRDVYPIVSCFGYAERIVTAAGFNIMAEIEALRERHRFVPFPRLLDGEFARAANAMRHFPHSREFRSVTLRA